MNQIGLSLEILLQIQYHWYYGLVVTKNKTDSLGCEIKEIFKELDEKKRSEKLVQLEQEFNHFVGLSFLYRNLLWLLNSSIRKNYYLRSAIHANLIFEGPWNHSAEYNPVFLSPKHQEALSKGYLFIGACRNEYIHFNQMIVNNILNGDYKYIPLNDQQSGSQQSSFFQNNHPTKIETMNADEDSRDPLVQITLSIREKLQVLGCNVDNDTILLSDIKKAYKLKALKTHPDKNPNSQPHTQFLLVKDAYDAILEHIDHPSDLKNLCNQRDIVKAFADIEEVFQKKVREVESYLNRAQALIAETEVLQSEVRAYLANRNKGLFRSHQSSVQENISYQGLGKS